MIKYTLKCKSIYCSNQNTFDGWFQNMESFEKQKSKDLILCPLCGSDNIIKSLSTPALSSSKNKLSVSQIEKDDRGDKKNTSSVEVNDKMNKASIILRAIKKEIQKNSEYVGNNFAKEARSIKEGETKERSIYGHGTNKEIEELKDEGINILNIPWVPDDH
ncbi:DUF1178 family protein [Alphaproteobacteria bacterium]|nr:DUF1178 family protein [Alphaproteobacteria bacterium]MDC1210046.1 DUF1178 family protein [Pseudomonadota bacterium]